MRIIVEPEKREKIPRRIYEGVFEFALVGRHTEPRIVIATDGATPESIWVERTFSNVMEHDKCALIGRMFELIERIRGSRN